MIKGAGPGPRPGPALDHGHGHDRDRDCDRDDDDDDDDEYPIVPRVSKSHGTTQYPIVPVNILPHLHLCQL